ncbi:DUF4240 domain-containing protein [Bacillus subtilis subsp. subtilis]|nr:DUF4240 domain-containing protein [Bacillus subtilis subsp. subtilis]
MDRHAFWTLIEQARQDAPTPAAMPALLANRLAAQDADTILRWCGYFSIYHALSYKSGVWAAAYIIHNGCSDDGFDYFRGWLIGQGQTCFLAALRDPDSLATHGLGAPLAEGEQMLAAGPNAWFARLGIEQDYPALHEAMKARAPGAADHAALMATLHYADDIDAPWDDDDVEARVPRLAARLG